MEGPASPQVFAIVQLHKSVGISILLLSLVRLAWRLANPPPPETYHLARWEAVLSKAAHLGFYGLMIALPLTGWIMVSTSKLAIPTLLFGAVPWPHLPGLEGLSGAARHAWHEVGEIGHEGLVKVFYLLLALHVGGVLKHQLFKPGEPVLARMAPGARVGRRLEPRLFLIAAGVLAVVAFGRLVTPPLPHAAPRPATAAVEEPAVPEAAAPTGVTQPSPPAALETPGAAPIAWAVAQGSNLDFATTWGGSAIEGRFTRWSGDIQFSPQALDRSRVRITIDMASADTGDAQRDQSLPSADWFDAANHPKAVFTARRFEALGEDRFVAHGELTLRGVTAPLDLPFRLQIDGDKARARGVTTLDRTAFGVGQGDWKSTDQIPAGVRVSIDVKATRR
jgi:polyisoprenoid-binding protein YceI/cytochrome b561